MATSQVFLALCIVGVAVAAPQFSLGRSRSVTEVGGNQEQVISTVIAALEPNIEVAIRNALASLNQETITTNEISAAEAEAAAKEEELRQQQILLEQEAARQEEIRRQEERRQQQIALANAAAAAAAEKTSFDTQVANDLGPHVKPVYNFEYKVANDDSQTYISRDEQRDGDELTGSYSYVDATGALITVEYTAGGLGYSETRTKEDGFVTMRAQPAWTGPLAGVSNVSTSEVTVARGSGSGSQTSSAFGSNSKFASSASFSQSNLIAQIIKALTPQINSAVSSALA